MCGVVERFYFRMLTIDLHLPDCVQAFVPEPSGQLVHDERSGPFASDQRLSVGLGSLRDCGMSHDYHVASSYYLVRIRRLRLRH